MRKKPITIGLALLLGLVCTLNSHAQTLQNVQASFEQYNHNAPQEKIYVHTDKNSYIAGELMWLKLYYVDGTYQRPADMSKVAYVEIVDKNQDAVIQAKISLSNGIGSGSVFVPVNLATGNYVLRAYTSWMKNFSPDFYFHKNISIIQSLKISNADVKAEAPQYDIQFFPEGGNLVNGISSTVGVKVTNQWGKGVNFKGAVLDKNNDTVARFAAYKFGMGHFDLKPDNQAAYHAVINAEGKTVQKTLPEILGSGYVMHVADDHSGKLNITISASQQTGNVYLFAHTRNSIKDAEMAAIENGVAHFSLDKAKLGDGISHLTVFNAQRQPVCERLYFKRPAKQLMVNAGSDQLQYNTRKKINIAIDTKDGDNKSAPANLSLSIYKVDSLQYTDNEDIESYLWLASDLKGRIESPAYYFKSNDAEAEAAADNLMLTQGWRRFNWSDVLKNSEPAFNFLPEYNGPMVNGRITNIQTNKLEKDIVTYLAVPGKRVQMYTSKSDSLGRLLFNMKDFYGPGEIIVQPNTSYDTTYRIDVLSPFSEQFAKIALPPFQLRDGAQADITNGGLAMQVQNTYASEKLRQFYDLGIDSSAFYGPPTKTYLLDNYTRFTTMEEVMREYVREANISHTKTGFHILVLNPSIYSRNLDPMVLIDGVPFFNINAIFNTSALKIRKLEVVPYIYYWGASDEEGIFSYTSYKGDLAGAEIDPHALVMDYEGLEQQRVFYAPEYDTDRALASRLPDYRNVLYWAPNVNTDAQGKAGLSFYSSDQAGQYIGVVQGMAADGEAGSRSFTFRVVK